MSHESEWWFFYTKSHESWVTSLSNKSCDSRVTSHQIVMSRKSWVASPELWLKSKSEVMSRLNSTSLVNTIFAKHKMVTLWDMVIVGVGTPSPEQVRNNSCPSSTDSGASKLVIAGGERTFRNPLLDTLAPGCNCSYKQIKTLEYESIKTASYTPISYAGK